MRWLVLTVLALACGCGGGYEHQMSRTPATATVMEAGDVAADAAPSFEDDSLAVAGYAAAAPPAKPMADAPPAPPAPPESKADVAPGPLTTEREAQRKAGPLLIYQARLHMAVFETEKSIDAVHKLALDAGGYLVRRQDRGIVVRVPAEKFREVVDAVGKLGDALHREETVEDVTEKFFDMQTRLGNARTLRARLQELLGQAKNVEEALMVERELARVTQEIELLEGKLKLLRELVAFSTLHVEFRARAADTVKPGVRLPFPWLEALGLSHLLNL
jgi:hypothetical protein